MKLDCQRDATPIIRLYDFEAVELDVLRHTTARLIHTQQHIIAIHELPFVQAELGCRLTLRLGSSDLGLYRTVEANLFGWVFVPGAWDPWTCSLTSAGWRRVVEGMDLLLRLRFLCNEQVWLHKQWNGPSQAAWLLSPTGEW